MIASNGSTRVHDLCRSANLVFELARSSWAYAVLFEQSIRPFLSLILFSISAPLFLITFGLAGHREFCAHNTPETGTDGETETETPGGGSRQRPAKRFPAGHAPGPEPSETQAVGRALRQRQQTVVKQPGLSAEPLLFAQTLPDARSLGHSRNPERSKCCQKRTNCLRIPLRELSGVAPKI